MNPFKGDAFKDLTSLQERMNRIFSESLKRLKEMSEPEEEKRWSPPVDIFELPEAFVLMAEIPGIPRQSVSVEIQDGALIIRGERPPVEGVSQGSLYHSERYYGPFERTFNLPVNADPGRIQARFADGVLTVTIGKPDKRSERVRVNIE